MNEEKEMDFSKKENTIDILVSPKKEDAPHKAPASSAGTAIPPRTGSSTAPGAKKIPTGEADRTRAIPGEKSIRTSSGSKIADQTRVGSGVVIPEKSTATLTKPSNNKGQGKNRLKLLKNEKKEPTPEEKKAILSSLRSTAMMALIYIAVVVTVSAVLSYFGISWANDVFALVKDEVVATVVIPENATLSEVADILEDSGLIEYPTIFRLYIGFKNRDANPPLGFRAGEHELRSTLNYDQMVSAIKNRRSRAIETITIPEGYTVDQIIELFTSKGIGTRQGFEEAINQYPYDYEFMDRLNQITFASGRRYRLEGYLFPDTYDFYTDSSEVAIVDKMLAAFEAHFEREYYARLDELNMNLDQVITLASIIQMEGKFNADFYPISGVFHNRLASKHLKRMQSDATVQYCLPERKPELTYADLEVDDPYNTYRYAGLPPSAIANPGWDAIQAALYPQNHKYYYFISDTDGSTLFAVGEHEHLRNVNAVAKAKANGTSVD